MLAALWLAGCAGRSVPVAAPAAPEPSVDPAPAPPQAPWRVLLCDHDVCSAELFDERAEAVAKQVYGADAAVQYIPPPWSNNPRPSPDRTDELAAALGIPAEVVLWTFPQTIGDDKWWYTPDAPGELPSQRTAVVRIDPVWQGKELAGVRVWLANDRFSDVAVSRLDDVDATVVGVAQAPDRSLDQTCRTLDMDPVPLDRPGVDAEVAPKCTRLPLPGGDKLLGSVYLVRGEETQLCAVHDLAGRQLPPVCRPFDDDEHSLDVFTSGQMGGGTSTGLVEAWFEVDEVRRAVLNVHNVVHKSRCVVPFPTDAMPTPDPMKCSESGYFHGWP